MNDNDYQDSDQELDPDEEEYLLDEILNENIFITDPFFYWENILEIEVEIYNPRLPEPSDWPVDPHSFPLPPKTHPDPLPFVDDNEPRRQALANTPIAQDTSSPPILVGSKDGQNSGSKKEERLTIKHDIPNNAPVVSSSTSVISTSKTEGDR